MEYLRTKTKMISPKKGLKVRQKKTTSFGKQKVSNQFFMKKVLEEEIFENLQKQRFWEYFLHFLKNRKGKENKHIC